MTKQKFDVVGMTCDHCVAHVGKAVRELAGVAEVEVSLDDAALVVEYNAAQVGEQAIIDAVVEAGYEAKAA